MTEISKFPLLELLGLRSRSSLPLNVSLSASPPVLNSCPGLVQGVSAAHFAEEQRGLFGWEIIYCAGLSHLASLDLTHRMSPLSPCQGDI